jgi:hypothetical protein
MFAGTKKQLPIGENNGSELSKTPAKAPIDFNTKTKIWLCAIATSSPHTVE